MIMCSNSAEWVKEIWFFLILMYWIPLTTAESIEANRDSKKLEEPMNYEQAYTL